MKNKENVLKHVKVFTALIMCDAYPYEEDYVGHETGLTDCFVDEIT